VNDRTPTGARALERLRALRPDLLAPISAVGCAGHGMDELCQGLASLVPDACDLHSCLVYVLGDDGRELRLHGAGDRTGGTSSGTAVPRYPIGQGLPGWVAAHRSDGHRPATGADAERLCLPVVFERSGLIAVVEVSGQAIEPGSESAALLRLIVGTLTPPLCQARQLEQFRDRGASAERFAERAVAAQEAERARLSREIHDGISQRLAGVGFHLSAANSLLTGDSETGQVRAQIGRARELVDLASAEMRAAIAALRPPILDDLGLPAALSSLAREVQARSEHTDIEVALVGELSDPLPDHVQTALYRIAQEALANALAHAAAGTVEITLELSSRRATLTVSDDGRGFRPTPAPVSAGGDQEHPRTERSDSYGLRSMHERAELVGGWLVVSSRRGTGTQIRAVVPIPGSRPGGPSPTGSPSSDPQAAASAT
jgi:signal transduction histidine kinase